MLKISLPPAPQAEIRFPGLPDWLSRLLCGRGIRTAREAEDFLHPAFDQLLPPLTLPGAEEAVRILSEARETGKRVVIYGDYDVDGVCASAIVLGALKEFGLQADVYLPNRQEEGYGLNPAAVQRLSRDHELLLTVDCGISGHAEVRSARELGMTVIVTDHHRAGEQLPPADAVVSPVIGDYPFPYLCGAGVAWKLALALLGDKAKGYLDLAALATVADMVSLTGENRVIVALGLPVLSASSRPGLRMLMKQSGTEGTLTAEQVAFQLAPRLNACGRMADAAIALDLITAESYDRAEKAALKAEQLNRLRKEEEAVVVSQAEAQVQSMDLVENHALVICGENWNSGVVGLAAGKLAEKYAYPTVVLSEKDGLCVGSARSAGDVDIFQALSQCADLFLRFGGHRQAAGLTLEKANVEEFRRRLSRAVDEQTGGTPPLPQIQCDGELTLEQVTAETIAWLSRLEPFGVGNPAPRFLCGGAESLSLRPVGAEGRHLKCTFRQGNTLRDGIFFGAGDRAEAGMGVFDLVFSPTLNVFRGRESAELHLQAMELKPEALREEPEREFLAMAGERKGTRAGEALELSDLKALMRQSQGTLLYCRCLKTALRMRILFPETDFCLSAVRDARAYNTVLLYGNLSRVESPFRRIVYCDGPEDSAFENGDVYHLPQTEALDRLLCEARLDQAALRECYKALKAGIPAQLEDYARLCGVSLSRAAFALRVFSDIGLIECSLSPFAVTLLPVRKCSPEESRLYQKAARIKEG